MNFKDQFEIFNDFTAFFVQSKNKFLLKYLSTYG